MRIKSTFVQHNPMRKVCEAALYAVHLHLIENGFQFADPAESPIEEVFGAAIYAHYKYVSCSSHESRLKIWPPEQFDAKCDELSAQAANPFTEYDVLCTSQYDTGVARVDFIFAHKNWRSGKVFRLVVECDGHDFHERTKGQAERDRSRDRMFQEKGWGIFRFTGSEIWRDPMGCAAQVSEWLDEKSSEK